MNKMIANINLKQILRWNYKTLSPAARLQMMWNLYHDMGISLEKLNTFKDWEIEYYYELFQKYYFEEYQKYLLSMQKQAE